MPPLVTVMTVSIHAPVKGATAGLAAAGDGECFNPRAREGRDSTAIPPAATDLFQSTRP